jgi:hypothetical protein
MSFLTCAFAICLKNLDLYFCGTIPSLTSTPTLPGRQSISIKATPNSAFRGTVAKTFGTGTVECSATILKIPASCSITVSSVSFERMGKRASHLSPPLKVRMRTKCRPPIPIGGSALHASSWWSLDAYSCRFSQLTASIRFSQVVVSVDQL